MIRLIRLTAALAWLFVLCMQGSAFAEGNNPRLPDNFRKLLQSGQWVTLFQQHDGYRVHIMIAKPEFQEVSVSDVNVRYAQAQHKLASAEYQRAVEVNKEKPGAVSKAALGDLELEIERASLSLEKAREDFSREQRHMSRQQSIQQIFHVGTEYVGMRDKNRETFIRTRLIGVITRDVTQASSADE